MSDPTTLPSYTWNARVPVDGGTALSYAVRAAFLEDHGDTYLLVDGAGAVVAAFPLGTVVVREDSSDAPVST